MKRLIALAVTAALVLPAVASAHVAVPLAFWTSR